MERSTLLLPLHSRLRRHLSPPAVPTSFGVPSFMSPHSWRATRARAGGVFVRDSLGLRTQLISNLGAYIYRPSPPPPHHLSLPSFTLFYSIPLEHLTHTRVTLIPTNHLQVQTTMTRSHKANDIPHNHPEAEAAFDEHKIPKFFGKTGFADNAPNKTKKNGGGKGNWYGSASSFSSSSPSSASSSSSSLSPASSSSSLPPPPSHNPPASIFHAYTSTFAQHSINKQSIGVVTAMNSQISQRTTMPSRLAAVPTPWAISTIL